jgi:hypothetical protein
LVPAVGKEFLVPEWLISFLSFDGCQYELRGFFDFHGTRWKVKQSTKDEVRIFLVSMLQQPPWRLWKEEDANKNNGGNDTLDANDHAPRYLVLIADPSQKPVGYKVSYSS